MTTHASSSTTPGARRPPRYLPRIQPPLHHEVQRPDAGGSPHWTVAAPGVRQCGDRRLLHAPSVVRVGPQAQDAVHVHDAARRANERRGRVDGAHGGLGGAEGLQRHGVLWNNAMSCVVLATTHTRPHAPIRPRQLRTHPPTPAAHTSAHASRAHIRPPTHNTCTPACSTESRQRTRSAAPPPPRRRAPRRRRRRRRARAPPPARAPGSPRPRQPRPRRGTAPR